MSPSTLHNTAPNCSPSPGSYVCKPSPSQEPGPSDQPLHGPLCSAQRTNPQKSPESLVPGSGFAVRSRHPFSRPGCLLLPAFFARNRFRFPNASRFRLSGKWLKYLVQIWHIRQTFHFLSTVFHQSTVQKGASGYEHVTISELSHSIAISRAWCNFTLGDFACDCSLRRRGGERNKRLKARAAVVLRMIFGER